MNDTPIPDETIPTFTAPALEVLEVLRSARRNIADGYSRHLCRCSPARPRPLHQVPDHMRGFALVNGVLRELELGAMCSPLDEGVRFFDLRGAFEAAARWRVDAGIVAENLLWRLLDPSLRTPLDVLTETMPLPAILAALDRAILRAHAVTRRK